MRGSRQVISLPRLRARVTEHLVLERACPTGSVDPGTGLERYHRGPPAGVVQSEVSVLREECGSPSEYNAEMALWTAPQRGPR